MTDTNNDASNLSKGLLIGLLAGGTVGAALALLFAPKSGQELRSDISDLTTEYVDKMGEMLNSATERAQEIVNDGRARAENIIGEARDKASTLLSDAERIVSDARAKAGSAGGKVVGDVKDSASRLADATKAGTEAFKEELRTS